MKSKKRTSLLAKILIYSILVFVALIVLLPVAWILVASFSPADSLYSALSLKGATLRHYGDLFTQMDFGIWYLNTLKIAICNMLLSIVLTMGSAYVFSRFRFPGRKASLMTIMILQMFPSIMSMTAIYILLQLTNMLDTHLALILVYAGGQIPYNTWLVKGYMDGIPKSLDEAAKIDGASNFTIFRKVVLPVATPIMTYLALTSFLSPWMDYIFPQMVLKTPEKRTLAIALFAMVTGESNTQFTTFAAGAVLVALPISILYLFLQKYVVAGLTAGANKV